jgi:phosphopantothenoylcysteine decarboxylase/phosphopantothenate--cysteine ligase
MKKMNSKKSSPTGKSTVILGVTGGIAAYKSAWLARLLVERFEVRVIMTPAARRFITDLTFRALTGAPVLGDMFSPEGGPGIAHIDEAGRASLIVIAPATADTIARLAAGRASDLLGAVVLASRCPVLLAPGMNTVMWESPITRDNVMKLRSTGRFHVVGPEEGRLACGWEGAGKMSEPEEICRWAAGVLRGGPTLEGRHVIVTAGPTEEDIDPVRFVSNRSSGRMGYALARAAKIRGAGVTLISGPVSLPPPSGVTTLRVKSASQMLEALISSMKGSDVVFMAAAVADWKPRRPSKEKIGKEKTGSAFALELERTPDILSRCTASRKGRLPLVVGFCLESSRARLLASARAKMKAKRCDLMAANLAGDSLGGEEAAVTVVDGKGRATSFAAKPKDEIAHDLLDLAARLLPPRA